MKWLWAAVGMVLLGAWIAWPQAQAPQLTGRPAPEFNLPAVDSSARIASADWHGRVWVLNVWASWCGPCRAEHEVLMALAKESALPLVGLDTRDDPRAAQEWLLRGGNPYAACASDADGQVARRYGADGVPMSFVVDREGIVRLAHAGPLTREVWEREVLPLLRGEPPLAARESLVGRVGLEPTTKGL